MKPVDRPLSAQYHRAHGYSSRASHRKLPTRSRLCCAELPRVPDYEPERRVADRVQEACCTLEGARGISIRVIPPSDEIAGKPCALNHHADNRIRASDGQNRLRVLLRPDPEQLISETLAHYLVLAEINLSVCMLFETRR